MLFTQKIQPYFATKASRSLERVVFAAYFLSESAMQKEGNMNNKMTPIVKCAVTAVCMALCVVLPMVLHAIPNAGTLISPMHLPVLLCCMVCGWQ